MYIGKRCNICFQRQSCQVPQKYYKKREVRTREMLKYQILKIYCIANVFLQLTVVKCQLARILYVNSYFLK